MDLLRSAFHDDPDMVDLLELFLADLPVRIAAFRRAELAGDVPQIVRLAHQLKGAAGGYGYPTLTVAAGELEQAPTTKERLDHVIGMCFAALAARPVRD